ncbi:endolytic transglycosylase MltG [Curvibacter sp. RS43]|nr:endolytic transglycosylase MltG [Curvibacter sp. RS43]MDD0810022.1 endolytic transglycosylase MltG [Curvibacter sp. RS43]
MLVVLILAAAALGGTVYWWLDAPLRLSAPTVDLSIEPGTSPRALAQDVQDAGVDVNPYFLYAWFRFSGQARGIKAGSYELDASLTPRRLLNKLVRGEEALRAVTLVEGWNWRQVRAALARADQLRGDTRELSDEAIMRLLERPGVAPEGRFFPDTYTYSKGSTDLAVLRRALRAMDKKLAAAWDARADQLPLKSPDEVLTLASIVEKETGRGSDRPLIASVFINRLRSGMLLQTDPTVIYGLGERFDGNLRKRDLQTDTPWNTYTRAGLPPTPIAMPGRAALLAAVQPANSKSLYFVARGDGSSQFSSTLDEHNRAVNQYQRRP